jgi:hypothetical protein
MPALVVTAIDPPTAAAEDADDEPEAMATSPPFNKRLAPAESESAPPWTAEAPTDTTTSPAEPV